MTRSGRLSHFFSFEIITLLMIISALLYYTNMHFLPAFSALLVISAVSIIWNFIFNCILDQCYKVPKENRTMRISILSMLMYEAGLVVLSIPIIFVVLRISLIDALLLSLLLMQFGMLYTLVFNYCYNHYRLRFSAPYQYSLQQI